MKIKRLYMSVRKRIKIRNCTNISLSLNTLNLNHFKEVVETDANNPKSESSPDIFSVNS